MNKSPACRRDGESKEDCVSRKVPEILAEPGNEDMSQDQAVAIAESVCEKPCKEKLLDELAGHILSLRG